jgi:iron(III) transport system permease protein
MIAMATRTLAFCTRTVNATGVQMHAELDEAAYASGLSRLTTFRRIFLPLVAPALLYAGVMVAMLVARELTLPLMMDTGRFKLVATLIFDLQTNGNLGGASAVGLIMVAILVALALAVQRFAAHAALPGAVRARTPRRDTAVRWHVSRPHTSSNDSFQAGEAAQGGRNARLRTP